MGVMGSGDGEGRANTPPSLPDADYGLVQQQLALLARIAAGLPLDAFLQRIAAAEALAPILDPTLYARGADRLAAVRSIATAARDFVRAVAPHMETLAAPPPPARRSP